MTTMTVGAHRMGSRSILQDAAEGRAIVRPWTIDLYHRAIAEGWLEESTAFELLDGLISCPDPSTIVVSGFSRTSRAEALASADTRTLPPSRDALRRPRKRALYEESESMMRLSIALGRIAAAVLPGSGW
jgi:hypothetical protein